MLLRYAVAFVGILTISMLYDRYKEKLQLTDSNNDYDAVQKYLLNDNNIAMSTKPILWIHVNYEPNSRHWVDFGSRKTGKLNKPYMHLTVKSIIDRCSNSFRICMIDDKSFVKLIPGWTTQIDKIASPMKDHLRNLAIFNLLYCYGGILVPPSFACKRDLLDMYNKGVKQCGVFVCDTVNTRNVHHDNHDLYPNTEFMGCKKNNGIMKELINYAHALNADDYVGDMDFNGKLDAWCLQNHNLGKISVIQADMIGSKTMHNSKVLLDDLMSDSFIPLYSDLYGLYIPDKELTERLNYGWVVRADERQVLSSKTFIGKFLLETGMGASDHTITGKLKNSCKAVFVREPQKLDALGLGCTDTLVL